MKLRCIKECRMIEDNRPTTSVGKIYDVVDENERYIQIIDDECDGHSFAKEENEYEPSFREWFVVEES